MIVSGIPFVAGRNDYADRDGTKYGIAIHNTSNTASAAAEASYATRRTDGVSAHFYADDTQVIQSVDTKYRAGHAGSYEGNEHAVAVEITGTNDKSRAWWIANVNWDKLGRVLAAVCQQYDIEPRRASVAEMQRNPKVRAFYSHNDMRQAWGGTTHTDPGPSFPWDYLFAAVKAALTPEDDMTPAELFAAQLYNPVTKANAKYGEFIQSINSEAYKARLTAEATLAAVKGLDTKAILARINEVATADAQRDAQLADLVRQANSGELAAETFVQRVSELFAAAGATPQQG